MNSDSLYRWFFILSATIHFLSCANESVPQGGKIDADPPKITKSSPPDKTLRFKSDKIQITFDEYLKYSTFPQTVISPATDKKPDIKMSGKHITVKFKTPLKDSTTYTINFADDIKDLNEGNVLPNFTYVFSTGDYIDSQVVFGNATLAKDNTPFEGAIVSLYHADSSDGILKSKPIYFAKTDKSGNFKIQNVKSGRYHIYALKDQNYNYIYDQPNELIAFSDTLVVLTDSLSKNINLRLFDENRGKVSLDNVQAIAPGQLRVVYNGPVQSFNLFGHIHSDADIWLKNQTKDTINYWYSNIYIKRDTLFLAANDSILDTVRMDLKFLQKDSLSDINNYSLLIVNQSISAKDTITKNRLQSLYKPLKINLSRPVTSLSPYKRPELKQDSMTIESSFLMDEKSRQVISIDFNKKENTAYSIEFPDSMFLDIFGMWSKRMSYLFKTDEKDDYGNLHLTLQTEHPEKYYIIQLMNANNEIEYEFFFTGNGDRKVSLPNIPAGSYRFVVIDDSNKNGRWDTGNLKSKMQPENIFTYKDTYELKGGWDLDIEVKF